jgi:hypothetical protein
MLVSGVNEHHSRGILGHLIIIWKKFSPVSPKTDGEFGTVVEYRINASISGGGK